MILFLVDDLIFSSRSSVRPIDPQTEIVDDKHERWDGASVHELDGNYGDYLLGKVSKVFPELRRRVD